MSKLVRVFTVLGLVGSNITRADNFANVRYDPNSDDLVVTMSYRGTNPDHEFSVKWDECKSTDGQNEVEIVGEVLDSQFQDAARQTYKKTVRFSLRELSCQPTKVTLRTAPRFYYTVAIQRTG